MWNTSAFSDLEEEEPLADAPWSELFENSLLLRGRGERQRRTGSAQNWGRGTAHVVYRNGEEEGAGGESWSESG
eukprot:6190376-Pleurochrysis_carterae.AAC.1